jgi:cytochrome c oxidase cbb3-type subunit 4
MDINDLRSLFTVLTFFAFIGIVWWAYSSRRRESYEAASRIPLEDDLPAEVTGPGADRAKY